MTRTTEVYEKLGTFYLGREYELENSQLLDELILYDSRDLCTHAVLVGMTGSGKTGLGVTLLEEAAIDGIPALVIDPKGDMANLLLNFPDLKGSDLQPWIDRDEAARAKMTVGEYAASQAELWQQGLASWGQDGSRIRRLQEAVEFTVFTPGSDAGVPLSIISSFAVPPAEVLEDADLMRDRVSSTATSILSLVGIDADPVRSREHILLTIILDYAWRQGRDLDLGTIIRLVQDPPVQQVGVMNLNAFFPEKERFELAMTINNLLAAPSFQAWMQGEPLDIDALLFAESGKPRISIFSIAHLSDSQRHFFVSLLLNQTVGWMRGRSGTSSLRAMLYIDEIFGYMPPVAEPPTKKPLLTLLKQARAFGLGVVLATQNPADLDYKGLSNIGTWFLGRLQTERDKQRILDGLEGASNESGGTFDRATISEILSNVGKRIFLMHNVHEDGPAVFQTRWALSYLSGPMTRDQIKKLTANDDKKLTANDDKRLTASGDKKRPRPSLPVTTRPQPAKVTARPELDPKITELFLPIEDDYEGTIIYEPHVIGVTKVCFVDSRRGLSADEEVTLVASVDSDVLGLDWEDAEELTLVADDLASEPATPSEFEPPSGELAQSKVYPTWKKQLANHLYRTRRFELFKSSTLKEYSRPHETERAFRIRLGEVAREERDAALDKLRKKYASKIRTLEDRILRAEQQVEIERQEASGAQLQSAISWGTTILSAVLGRKKLGTTTFRRAASAARGTTRSQKQKDDIARAQIRLDRYESQLQDLESELLQEEDLLRDKFDPLKEELDTIQLKPRRNDIEIRVVGLAWIPFAQTDDGRLRRLCE